MSLLRKIGSGISSLISSFRKLIGRDDEDVREVADMLVDMRRETWEDTMRLEAARFGFSVDVTLDPETEKWIKDVSLEDARQIMATADRDSERFLQHFADANPNATADELAAAYDQWMKKRLSWKVDQIVTQTEYTTQSEALQRFWEANDLTGAKFRFMGPPPVCPDCVGLMMAGPVSWDIVRANPTPRHVNCTHSWAVAMSTISEKPKSIWVG